MRRLMTLLLLTAAAGCGEVREGATLTGWRFEWDQLSHRISYLSVGLEPVGEAAGELTMGTVGGDWSTGEEYGDFLRYRAGAAAVSSNRAAIAGGSIELTIAPASAGSEFTATGEVEISLEEIGKWRDYTAFISGFSLNTDAQQSSADYPVEYTPSYGYTSAGFGVQLGEPAVDEGAMVASVPVTVRFAHGPTGETFDDREHMDAAIPEATTAATVQIALVGFRGEREDVILIGDLAQEHDPPNSDAEPLLFDASSTSGGSRKAGLPGWRAFDLVVNEGGAGDYLRAFGVEVLPESTDPGMVGDVEAIVSNSSVFELDALSFALDAEMSILHLGGDTVITPVIWEGDSEIGDWRVGNAFE